MAYIALGRVAQALEALRRFHPFFGVTFLSMKESGVTSGDPIAWGSMQEQNLLNRYYKPEGAPQGKEYYVPFSSPEQEHGNWKNPKYSGGSLQRARTTDQFKSALRHPSKKDWAFTRDYVDQLAALLPGRAPDDRLPLNDLIAWIYRNEEVPLDLSALQKRFIGQFRIDENELSKLFSVSSEEPDSFFFDAPIERDDLNQLIGGIPKGASFAGRSEADLISFLVSWIREKDQIILPDGFVESVYFSLKTQQFVVLAGRPGTAKTAFARSLAAALSDFFGGAVNEVLVPIGKEFTEADVVGYEKISGELASTELTKKLFLSGRVRDLYVVILDEMNLSEVDNYFSRLLPAIESGTSVDLPGVPQPVAMPTDTFVVGTINSYLEEPSRMPLSGPVKRRANIIEMPNHLTTIITSNDRQAFDNAAAALVKQSLRKAESRLGSQSEGVFDQTRAAAFKAALQSGGRASAPVLLDLLWAICGATSGVLTLGILQDIIDYVSLSHEDIVTALDRQIARKIVPQLSGVNDAANALLELISTHQSAALFKESSTALADLFATSDSAGGTVIYKY